MCGATGAQKQIGQEQNTQFQDLINQSKSIFGFSSTIMSQLIGSLAPIVAAGPNQQGWSVPLMDVMNSQVISTVGQQYKNASQSVREQQAAFGGGNVALPSGANTATDLSLSEAAAGATSSGLINNQITSLNQGRQNFFAAESALAGAPQVFNPATSAAEAATGAGSAAANTQNQIAQAGNAWMGPVFGALGGIAGDVATGGLSNMAQGVGFFGQNAPAPNG